MTVRDLLTNFLTILPVTFLFIWGCALLLLDSFLPARRKSITPLLTAIGLVVAAVLEIIAAPSQVSLKTVGFNGMVVVDGFTLFLNLLFLGCGLAGVGLAYEPIKRMGFERNEFYILLTFSITGMMLMAYASDLIIVFISLELLSLPLYVLTGLACPRDDCNHPESGEAAVKYFLLGAFSGGIVLYGVALIFGATGHTTFESIRAAVLAGTAQMPLFTLGAALLLVGLGFKVALAPFHMWTPDVYQGAPAPVAAFMSAAVKAAGFAALIRVFSVIFQPLAAQLTPVLWGLAALTMIWGNFTAIAQTNLKRLLAYSSIAHAGYILMSLVVFDTSAVVAALFYLVAYAIASFGAWGLVVSVEKDQGQVDIQDLAGLGHKYPWLAVAMSIFMFSMIGMPPTLGFVGKLYLFSTAIENGQVALAILGVLTSLVSAYYYLHIIVVMFMQPGEPEVRSTTWLNVIVTVAALAAVLLSLLVAPLFNAAVQATLAGL